MAPPLFEPLEALCPRLARGEFAAEALLDTCLDQIAAHDRGEAGLGAIIQINPRAREEARGLDARLARTGRPQGPLHGAPVVLKDNIDMAGLATTSGSRALAGAVARRDAAQTQRLRRAGAVIVAKANMSEFSFEIRSRSSIRGDVRNPFNRAVTAGGSSGGVAAAVAAGFAAAGIGTDTGGSIRTPAAYTGLVGLRPTAGLIDIAGVAPLAPTTDTIGPIVRTAGDLDRLLGVMADAYRVASGRSADLAGARLGVLRQAFGIEAQVTAAIDEALARARSGGAAIIDPVQLDDDLLPIGRDNVVEWEFRLAIDAYLAQAFEPGSAPANLAAIYASGDFLESYRDDLGRRASVQSLDAHTYRALLDHHAALRRGLGVVMDAAGVDALVYPTSAATPDSLDKPAGGWAPELAARAGWPAITLPVGRAANGVPIGLELLGRAGDESRLIGLAIGFERLLGARCIPDLDL